MAMENMDGHSSAAKIVREELEIFLHRTRERLNTITSDSVSLDDLSKEIRQMVSYRLGFPNAKAVATLKRSKNDWNTYQKENFKRVKTELGTPPLFLSELTLDGSPSRSDVLRRLVETYKSREPENTASSAPTSPMSTSSESTSHTPTPVGDALIRDQGPAEWNRQRNNLFNEIKKIVSS